MSAGASEVDCVVVGGGLAGLRAGVEMARAGRSVHLVEAETHVGGRARTEWFEGQPVDRGFQTLFSGYPQTRRFVRDIGIPSRDLRPFSSTAVYVEGGTVNPVGLWGGPRPSFGGAGRDDLISLARLLARCRARAPEAWLDEDDGSVEDLLAREGFSPGFVDRFIRPLFGPILLDRRLGADAGYFRFLLSVMTRGRPVIPSDGLGMIAEWAAAALRVAGGRIDTETRVVGLDRADGGRVEAVRLDDGRTIRCAAVVLAAGHGGIGLLRDVAPEAVAGLPERWCSAVNVAFALDRPLYRGRTVLLNGAVGPGLGVDLLCQTTNVVRPDPSTGPHIVIATLITTDLPDPDDETAQAAVADFVDAAAPHFRWSQHARPVAVFRHREALPAPEPGARAGWERTGDDPPNVILAGDLVAHPSIEGAVGSGAAAARRILGAAAAR